MRSRVHHDAMIGLPLQPPGRSPAFSPLLFGSLGLLLLGCTTSQQTPQQRAAYAACRSQAEQQFNIQNRASLYQTDSSLTPYAGPSSYLAPTQSLADQFSHRQMVQDCLRGATGPAPVAPANSPPAIPPPPPPPPNP